MADQPTCLCVVSRDRLCGNDFVAALEASLRPHEQLAIIVDRRSGEPSDDRDPAEDRRRRPQVDLALKANGFAVVPAPGLKGERSPSSLLVPSAPSSDVSFDDDQEMLEAIRSFKRERSPNLAPWLIAVLVAAAAAAFILSPKWNAVKQIVAQRISPDTTSSSTPPPTARPEPPPRSPVVVDNSGAAEAPVRALDVPTGAPANDASPVGRPRSTEAARPSASASAPRQVAVAPAPAEPVARAVSPRFAGLPRVELSHEPASGTYSARIVDPGGKPLPGAEVWLLARMPDGTVEHVRMDFSSERGTYRGSLPTTSPPVDLRVRVITSDKRVEIPLGT